MILIYHKLNVVFSSCLRLTNSRPAVREMSLTDVFLTATAMTAGIYTQSRQLVLQAL